MKADTARLLSAGRAAPPAAGEQRGLPSAPGEGWGMPPVRSHRPGTAFPCHGLARLRLGAAVAGGGTWRRGVPGPPGGRPGAACVA